MQVFGNGINSIFHQIASVFYNDAFIFDSENNRKILRDMVIGIGDPRAKVLSFDYRKVARHYLIGKFLCEYSCSDSIERILYYNKNFLNKNKNMNDLWFGRRRLVNNREQDQFFLGIDSVPHQGDFDGFHIVLGRPHDIKGVYDTTVIYMKFYVRYNRLFGVTRFGYCDLWSDLPYEFFSALTFHELAFVILQNIRSDLGLGTHIFEIGCGFVKHENFDDMATIAVNTSVSKHDELLIIREKNDIDLLNDVSEKIRTLDSIDKVEKFILDIRNIRPYISNNDFFDYFIDILLEHKKRNIVGSKKD